MKRLSARRRRWFAHRRRAVAKARRSSERRGRKVVEIHAASGASWTNREPARRIALPAIVCFNKNCGATLSAIAGLRNNLAMILSIGRRRRRQSFAEPGDGARRLAPAYRDFSTMRMITPAAALVLASEYERRKILTGRPPLVANIRRWSPQVFTTLWEIGFFEIVGFPSGTVKPDYDEAVTVLRMRSGQSADANAIDGLIVDLKALYPSSEQIVHDSMTHLYGAMVEAVGNVCGHAYPDSAPHRELSVGRWWMTGAVDRAQRRTTAVIFDRGVSIPVTLPTGKIIRAGDAGSWQLSTQFRNRRIRGRTVKRF